MPPKIGKAATREEPPVAFQVPIENRESGHLILEEGEAIRKARMHSSCKPDKISPADRWGKEVSTGNSGEVLWEFENKSEQVACQELCALDEDEDELDAFLTEIDDEVDDLLAMVNATMSGRWGGEIQHDN